MSAPKRIQRQRTKGWRMPEGTVYVGRPSRWGNPFRAVRNVAGVGRRRIRPGWSVVRSDGGRADIEIQHASDRLDALEIAVEYFRLAIHPAASKDSLTAYPLWAEIQAELRGKDLACWCPLDQPCHADVLLEIANGDDQ